MSQKIPDAPITRSELYDAREIELLEQIAEGGLGPSVTVEPLSVTENGTYSEQGKAYSPVTVAVPEPVLDPLEVTQNGTYTPVHDGYSEVTVNVPTGGGGTSEPMRDVNFYDYDGAILHSYSAADFLALSAMPDNPSHDGLTAQGWNWSFADAQEYVGKYGMLEIGQMYITDDGKTRIYIHLEEGRLSPYLGICPDGSVDIDWGDGSAHDTVTGTSVSTEMYTQHTYAAAGDYVIKLTVTGEMGITGNQGGGSRLLTKNGSDTTERNSVYVSSIFFIEIGSGVRISGYAFNQCRNLAFVTIPNGTYFNNYYVFRTCASLKSATLPTGTANFGSAFVGCGSLKSVALPSSATNIGVFQNCYSLSRIALPNGLQSIGSNTFSGASSLRLVVAPDGIGSFASNCFKDCVSIATLTIPNGVTSIGSGAFQNCYGLGFIRFEPTTPPTVAASSAFTNIPTDCIIYVPAGTLSAYTTATNYPSASTYTYVEY